MTQKVVSSDLKGVNVADIIDFGHSADCGVNHRMRGQAKCIVSGGFLAGRWLLDDFFTALRTSGAYSLPLFLLLTIIQNKSGNTGWFLFNMRRSAEEGGINRNQLATALRGLEAVCLVDVLRSRGRITRVCLRYPTSRPSSGEGPRSEDRFA